LFIFDTVFKYSRLDDEIVNLRPRLLDVLVTAKDLLRNKEFVPGGVELKSNMNRLEKKFNALKDSSKQLINSKRTIDSQMKKFGDLKKSIENSITRKERMLNVLGPLGTSVTYGNVQLDQVHFFS